MGDHNDDPFDTTFDTTSLAQSEYTINTLVDKDTNLVEHPVKMDAVSNTLTVVKPAAAAAATRVPPLMRGDALRTRIDMPQGLTQVAANALAGNPFVPKNALGWHEPSPFEEDAKLTNEFVHACCRVHEAGAVVTALCNHFIRKWSGPGLPAGDVGEFATNAIEHGIGELPCHLGFGRNEYGISIEAVAVWAMLAHVQMQLALAGEQVGAILDLRSKAPPATKPDEKDDDDEVNDGDVINAGVDGKDGKVKEDDTINNFLPLAALEDCADTFMAFTGGFDLKANWKPLVKAASTLDQTTHFLLNGKWHKGTKGTSRLHYAYYSISYIQGNTEATRRFFRGPLGKCKILARDKSRKTISFSASDAVNKSLLLVMNAAEDLKRVMESIQRMHDEIGKFVKARQTALSGPAPPQKKTLFGIALPRKGQQVLASSPESTPGQARDEDLVMQASFACKQAFTAIRITQSHLRAWEP